jgi:hypothetical protein
MSWLGNLNAEAGQRGAKSAHFRRRNSAASALELGPTVFAKKEIKFPILLVGFCHANFIYRTIQLFCRLISGWAADHLRKYLKQLSEEKNEPKFEYLKIKNQKSLSEAKPKARSEAESAKRSRKREAKLCVRKLFWYNLKFWCEASLRIFSFAVFCSYI